ncbi:hemerythrin domain-containing protein [Longispora urticae]
MLGHHQQIKLLFGQVESATGEHKQELFGQLVTLLAVHENLEQQLVHPLAEQTLDGADVTVRLAEEEAAKTALVVLYDLGVTDPSFDAELATLRDAVTAHAKAEEELEFARLREVVDPDQLRAMVLVAEAANALSAPAGASDSSAPGLVGPPLEVFEHVRETLSKAAAKGRNGS